MWGIKKIAEILFIVLALLIIITVMFGYSSTLKESIMKFFGFETESERIHEQNTQAREEFENLLNHIEKCKSSKDTSCGCTFNIKKFDKNQIIMSRNVNIQVIDVTNSEKDEIIKRVNFGIPLETSEIKNTNCYFTEKLEKKDVNVARIFFDKEKPYLHSVGKVLFIPWQKEVKLNTGYPLYKDSKGNLCWLSEKATEISECK